MYSCAQCAIHACYQQDHSKMPANCPMRQADQMQKAFAVYSQPAYQDFYIQSCIVEAEGYGEWPRLRETIEFAKKLGYTRLGMAFCYGLRKEAKIVDSLLRRHGFEVVSVICKTGGIDKSEAGIPGQYRVRPERSFEAMCNPVAQAMLLNSQHTQLNISLGLCVWHDALFAKFSDALVTTLVVKDRALANNPVGAIYCAEGYLAPKLEP